MWKDTYPRPQFQRKSFLPLTEGWKRNGKRIQVPWEAAAEEKLLYRVGFRLPEDFAAEGDRILLHFGAVDQKCMLYVNESFVRRHEGGYLPFSADITDLLRKGTNQLRLEVVDRLSHKYGYGKQSRRPHGMWYTAVSGIWQPVWLEAVPGTDRIDGIRILPDLNGIQLSIRTESKAVDVEVLGAEGEVILSRRLTDKGDPVTGNEKEEKSAVLEERIDIPSPRTWTPDSPFLYRLILRTETDEVGSYFALRTFEIRRVGEYSRLFLNGEPVFLHGVLDQGYFRDAKNGRTLYLPEDPEEYERDILRLKELGFNTVRKHVKIEPDVFYHAADRLGILVLQDMVNSGRYRFVTETVIPNFLSKSHKAKKAGDHVTQGELERRAIFRADMLETISFLYNHPSVVGYTIFNEGWGQFEGDSLYEAAKEADPSRFFDTASGWFETEKSDVQSEHVYFKNIELKAKDPEKFLFLSECGGYTREVEGHGHEAKKYGYGDGATKEALMEHIRGLYEKMVMPSMKNGLCGCIYTQLSDVEGEINGLYTFDREVCKVSREGMLALAGELFARAGTWGSGQD